MQVDKKNTSSNDDKQNVQNTSINLNEYAGDSEDDQAAREQANQYVKEVNRDQSDSTNRSKDEE